MKEHCFAPEIKGWRMTKSEKKKVCDKNLLDHESCLIDFFYLQGDANRSYSDDDHSSSNFDESEKRDSIKLSGKSDIQTFWLHSAAMLLVPLS